MGIGYVKTNGKEERSATVSPKSNKAWDTITKAITNKFITKFPIKDLLQQTKQKEHIFDKMYSIPSFNL